MIYKLILYLVKHCIRFCHDDHIIALVNGVCQHSIALAFLKQEPVRKKMSFLETFGLKIKFVEKRQTKTHFQSGAESSSLRVITVRM